MLGLLLMSALLLAAVSGCVTAQAICDKGGISSIAGTLGPTKIVIVAEPVSGVRSVSHDQKAVDVHVNRYLFGTGPGEITVRQKYHCGSRRDEDYVDLQRSQTYLLFLTNAVTGDWRPYAVPRGFAADDAGNLSALDNARQSPPSRLGVTTVDDVANQIKFYLANTPTPYPTVPDPAQILKPGTPINLAEVLNIEKGFTFKSPATKKGGVVRDPDLLSRLAVALNTTLTFEPTSAPLSLETLGKHPTVIFSLRTPVFNMTSAGADFSPDDCLLLNPLAAPVQLRLPQDACDIISEAVGAQK